MNESNPAKVLSALLASDLKKNPHYFLFSPDETTSNRLAEAYEVTQRAWGLPIEPWDLPESAQGQIIELLSENVLLATMLGHVLNGQPAVMTSYESFFNLITSQLVQHFKFLKQSDAVAWRPKYPAVNLLSTSTCWRQDHNGFSHQSPLLISSLLSIPGARVNCLFPADDVAAEEAYRFMANTQNVVNLTTFNKTTGPRFLNQDHAVFQFENGGASIYEFVSDPDPDFIFTAAGDIPTREAIAAIRILKSDLPQLKFRFVGLTALTPGAIGTTEKSLDQDAFDSLFTADKPVIASFHGYKDTLKSILTNYAEPRRIFAHGFEEQGSTTTPFEMLTLNHNSCLDLAISVARQLGDQNLEEKYQQRINDNHAHASTTGEDLPEKTRLPELEGVWYN